MKVSRQIICSNARWIVLFLFILFAFLLTRINDYINWSRIMRAHQFVNGKTLYFEKAGYRQSDYFKISYTCNKIEYKKSQLAIFLNNDFENYFKNKQFPVIVNPEFPEDGEMLIFKYDFEKYGYVQPDSLSWVNKYER